MKIRYIKAKNFGRFDSLELDLPERGIVLVTGSNGHGKSTIMEAVAHGLWNMPLRGKPMWRDGATCRLHIHTENPDLEVHRKRAPKGTLRMSFNIPGETPTPYDTSTKAKDGLVHLTGSFAVWRQCSVLSSADAGAFTQATDGKRKALIESLLGMERFDAALKRCRVDLQGVRQKEARGQGRLETLQNKVDDCLSDLEDLNARKPADPAEETDTVSLEEQYESKSQRFTELKSALERERTLARVAEERLDKIQSGECPTCTQTIGSSLFADINAEAMRSAQSLDEFVNQTRDEIFSLTKELELLDRQLRSARETNRSIAQQHTRLLTWTDSVERAKLRLSKAEQALQAADTADLTIVKERQELEEVETVLGLQGVRAAVMGRSLIGLASYSNVVLDRIFPGVSVNLDSESQLKSGRTTARWALEVKGLDHAHGYQGCSTGEKCRIDVGILLGLAEMSAAARGVAPGTLFMDEVGDGLDAEGIDAVSQEIQRIAQTRAVVVISHSNELVANLRPLATKWLKVRDGRIQE